MKNKTIIKDFLLYVKFLIQYTDDNVPEKRLVVTLFIIYIVKRNIIIDITNIESFYLLEQIFNFFLNNDKISDYDKNTIKLYQIIITNNIKKEINLYTQLLKIIKWVFNFNINLITINVKKNI